MPEKLIIMGVAGCGKSSLAAEWTRVHPWALIEGDEFHPPENVQKMRAGQALTDQDRAGWLDALIVQMAHQSGPFVMTCSALKKAYRERLRQAQPGLRFVHLQLTPAQAKSRVSSRGSHYFNPELVDSQFKALECPSDESLVITLDATLSFKDLINAMAQWLEMENA